MDIWTITDINSLPIIENFSFISSDIKADAKVTSYPVEQGSFSTYNKTVAPLDISVTLSVEGDNIALQSVISVLETLRVTKQLVNIVTPITEYNNYALQTYNYSNNNSEGTGILIVDLKFTQVREVAKQYTNAITYPADPSAASTTDTGKKQSKSFAFATFEDLFGKGEII